MSSAQWPVTRCLRCGADVIIAWGARGAEWPMDAVRSAAGTHTLVGSIHKPTAVLPSKKLAFGVKLFTKHEGSRCNPRGGAR